MSSRNALFFRSLLGDNYRKKLVVAILIACVLIVLPTALHRPPSTIHHELSQQIPSSDVLPSSDDVVFEPFPFPEELKPQVKFWKDIFTQYTTQQAVIHDDRYLNVIYEVIDISSSEFANEKEGWQAVKAAKEEYEKLLQQLSEHWGISKKMTPEERRIYALFEDIAESSYFKKKDAKDRVHVQIGQADRFKAGIIMAGQYLTAMKAIFAEHELPEKLVYLPLIESAFNPFAESPVGATGMWQFMHATGKQYDLTITHVVDDRKDPLRATRAAAQLLAHNYEVIQSWPLAITAYNFGLQGIKNAAETMESENIVEIIEKYDGSRFGFASRNFYVEFLAAVDVCLRYTEYFGEIELQEPLKLAQISLSDYVSAKTLEKYSPLTVSEIKRLNPALHTSVFEQEGFIPKNYRLNILEKDKELFESQYASIPSALKYAYLPVKAKHRVKKGQTLSEIAEQYKTSVSAIAKINGISDPRKIRAGQILKIPGGYVSVAQKKSQASPTPEVSDATKEHLIKKDQTLSTIAKIYDTSVEAITKLNKISNPRKIRTGQILKIPEKTLEPDQRTTLASKETLSVQTEHRVKKGQTLSMIAKLHNTSVKAITEVNDIKNPRKIKPGQLLKIPEKG